MKYLKGLQGLIVAGGLAFAGSALASGPSGEMLANTCVGCHGFNGNSMGPAIPSIAGMSVTYFTDTMTGYKDGSRPATIMDRLAKGYSDEEIALMAEFFAAQKVAPVASQPVDTKLAQKGKRLHDKSCEKCHAESGRSAEDDSGILYGQMMPYLEYSFAEFKSGARNMPRQMKQQMDKMKADDLKALAHYYASLK
jgi:cytochrome subunit of sulfide dehydrogenase